MDAVRRHQYLKAMGITDWVPRYADDAADLAVAAPGAALPAASGQSLPVYLDHLANTAVVPVQSSVGDLLLITGPPHLSADDMQLLRKMLAAINVDLAEQGMVTLDVSGAVSVKEVIAHQRPKLVLIMAASEGDPVAMDIYRQQHHHPDWSPARLAITHHPADINHQAELKRPAWEDLKRVKAVLDG